MTIFLIIIIILSALGIIYSNIYNKLQYLKTKIEQAENLVDESLRFKYDQIISCNALIKKTLNSKRDYLKEYDKLKSKKLSNFELDRKLIEAQKVIEDLIHDHDILDKNKELRDILYEIKDLDEKLSAAKNYYNKNTTEANLIVRKFPSIIVAKIHNFVIKPFFDGKDMQDDIIKDFKL